MSITQEMSTSDAGTTIISSMAHTSSNLKEIASKAPSKMENKVSAPITTPMATSTKETGSMTSNTDKEKCSIPMEIATMAIGSKAKKMVKEPISLTMAPSTEEVSPMAKRMALEQSISQTELKYKQPGSKITYKVKVKFTTKMEITSKVSSTSPSNKDKEYTVGSIKLNTKEISKKI